MGSIAENSDSASYKVAGFNNRIGATLSIPIFRPRNPSKLTFEIKGWGKRPALLLVDVCKAYWASGSPLDTSSNPESVESVDVMRRLLATAREAKVRL